MKDEIHLTKFINTCVVSENTFFKYSMFDQIFKTDVLSEPLL